MDASAEKTPMRKSAARATRFAAQDRMQFRRAFAATEPLQPHPRRRRRFSARQVDAMRLPRVHARRRAAANHQDADDEVDARLHDVLPSNPAARPQGRTRRGASPPYHGRLPLLHVVAAKLRPDGGRVSSRRHHVQASEPTSRPHALLPPPRHRPPTLRRVANGFLSSPRLPCPRTPLKSPLSSALLPCRRVLLRPRPHAWTAPPARPVQPRPPFFSHAPERIRKDRPAAGFRTPIASHPSTRGCPISGDAEGFTATETCSTRRFEAIEAIWNYLLKARTSSRRGDREKRMNHEDTSTRPVYTSLHVGLAPFKPNPSIDLIV